jgi:hypothetical protein
MAMQDFQAAAKNWTQPSCPNETENRDDPKTAGFTKHFADGSTLLQQSTLRSEFRKMILQKLPHPATKSICANQFYPTPFSG